MFVYLITNSITNKQYVGITKRKFQQRIKQHKNYYKNEKLTSYLYNSMRKHGLDNFSFKILEEIKEKNLELLKEREIYWIKELNTKAPNGYNMSAGGDGMAERIVTEETRKKLSKTHLKRFSDPKEREKISIATKRAMTDEVRNKISKAASKRIGKKNSFFGKIHSEETKKKMRKPKTNTEKMGKYKRTKQHRDNISKINSIRLLSDNPMNNEEYRKKVGQSKIGRKRFYREDGSFYMAYPDNPIDPILQ